jgi:MFS transporter, putative metabolite:H+ symporter
MIGAKNCSAKAGAGAAEIYPTRIRAFASSVGGAWQRVAAASGPIVVAYLLTGAGLTFVFLYFGVVALIGAAVATAFTVETKNRSLETVSARAMRYRT